MEKLCQLLRSFSRDIVSPGAERNHQLSRFIKGHISVHHGTDTESTYACQFHAVFLPDIFCHILIAGLKALPDLLQAVGPDSVHILVLPSVTAGCDRLIFVIYQNCLDPCGTKLNTKSCTVLKNGCFCLVYSHFKKPPVLFAEIHAVPSQLILQIPDRCITININSFNTHSCCPVAHLLCGQIIGKCSMVCAARKDPGFCRRGKIRLRCPERRTYRKCRHWFLCLLARPC